MLRGVIFDPRMGEGNVACGLILLLATFLRRLGGGYSGESSRRKVQNRK